MAEIKIYRVPLFSSKNINVISVNGIPICACRGKRTTSEIITKISGYDVSLNDGRIDKAIEQIIKGGE